MEMPLQSPRAYAAHARLVNGLQPYAQLWRIAAGLALVALITAALVITSAFILETHAPGLLDWIYGAEDYAGNGNPIMLLLFLGGFGYLLVGVFLAGLLLHFRKASTMLGGWHSMWRHFRRSVVALAILHFVILALPPYDPGVALVPNLPLKHWLPLLPISLFAVLLQVSAEEVLFRGYLQQTLAARYSHPLVWIGVPSILFAIGHYTPTAGDNAMLIVVWAGIFGLLAADLTARAGTVGPAIALHFINNIIAILIVSIPNPDGLDGLSLYTLPFSMEDIAEFRPLLLFDLIILLACWLTLRIVLRR